MSIPTAFDIQCKEEEATHHRNDVSPLKWLIFPLSANTRLLHPSIAGFLPHRFLAASQLLMCKPTICIYAIRRERQILGVSRTTWHGFNVSVPTNFLTYGWDTPLLDRIAATITRLYLGGLAALISQIPAFQSTTFSCGIFGKCGNAVVR